MINFFVDVTTQTPDPFAMTGQLDADDLVTIPLTKRPRPQTWECACCGEEREGRVECGFCGA